MHFASLRLLGALLLGMTLSACSAAPSGLPRIDQAATDSAFAASPAYATTIDYVTTFYPLWFSYNQSKTATHNRLVGPDRMAPIWHEVVAPNDDTLYSSSFLDLSQQPDILTIPTTTDTWSLFSADPYGDVFETGISAPGTYALVGPNWNGTLPSGVTKVQMPTDVSIMIIRADRFSPSGTNEVVEARKFRLALRLADLSAYQSDPSSGQPLIVPIAAYAPPYKTIADNGIAKDPIKYLGQLQAAVKSSNTPPLSKADKALSDAFDAAYAARATNAAALGAAARRAHSLILNAYLYHTGKTNWISLLWSTSFKNDLERSAIAEFIQWGNDRDTAGYYQTFVDGAGNALDGSKHSYVLTFSKAQLPETKRFWSVTAYIPYTITLYGNSLNKYLVGSYTPGLKTGKNGSISIYVSNKQPRVASTANWLPVPNGPFNLMLRDYGPEGSVLNDTYVPPAVNVLK